MKNSHPAFSEILLGYPLRRRYRSEMVSPCLRRDVGLDRTKLGGWYRRLRWMVLQEHWDGNWKIPDWSGSDLRHGNRIWRSSINFGSLVGLGNLLDG